MKLRRRTEDRGRRERRNDAFRSTELNARLRQTLDPWFKREGYRHLGARAWKRACGDAQLMIAIQCRQSGWDPSAGSEFVVEFEMSAEPKLATGYHRDRIWRLLPEADRDDALRLIDSIAFTLPAPSTTFLSALPPSVQDHYLQCFRATDKTSSSSDVWFRYYDEQDADRWAEFLERTLGPAVDRFLEERPSFFGHRTPAADAPA